MDDHVPTGWTDEAAGVNITYRFEWISERTGSRGDWQKFSTPALWAVFSEDGVGVEYVYRRTQMLVSNELLVRNLASGTYTFEVRAVSDDGESPASNSVSLTIP